MDSDFEYEDDYIPDFEQPTQYDELIATDFNHGKVIERVGEERISPPILGRLAKSHLISHRAGALQAGAEPMIPINKLRSINLEEIAKQELEEGVIPLKIIRKFEDGVYEVWEIKDFEYIYE